MTRIVNLGLMIPLTISAVCAGHAAHGQNTGVVTDTVVIQPAWINYTLQTSGYSGPSVGEISSGSTLEGYSYLEFATIMADRGTHFDEAMSVGNVNTNPGPNWLQSIVCNGTTWPAIAGSYNATAHTLAYGYLQSSSPLSNRQFPVGTQVTCQLTHVGNSGWIHPKFQILGLTYAPPGSKSTATYNSGFLNGTSINTTASYSTGVTNKVSVSLGGTVGVVAGKATLSESTGWTQEEDSSNSVSVTQQETTGLIVPGPASSGVGVDHDYDTVYVWLNPMSFVEFGANQVVVQASYGYDARDTITGMDVVTVTIGQLKGTQPINAGLQDRLNRSWDSSLGGLTGTDYINIASADPFFLNPAFNPNTDTSHRFELPLLGSPAEPTDLIFNYIPVPPGGQATSQTFTSSYSSTSAAGKTSKDSHTTIYAVDATASASFFATVSAEFSSTSTYAYSNQWSNTVTSGTSQTMNFTIVPPLSTDNYTGPTAVQVWKDNVYGTFMFYPEE